jgi:hypothetical protein
MLAGAHIKSGVYAEGKGVTQVNMRTIEAMHGLPNSGAQQPNAAGAGIADEAIVTNVFDPLPQPRQRRSSLSSAAPNSKVSMTLSLWLMG